jgi:hypothetical protein
MTRPHYSSITEAILRNPVVIQPTTPASQQQLRGILRHPTTEMAHRNNAVVVQGQHLTPLAVARLDRSRSPARSSNSRNCCCCSRHCSECEAERRRRERRRLALGGGIVVIEREPERRHRRHQPEYREREVREMYYNRRGELCVRTYKVLERV